MKNTEIKTVNEPNRMISYWKSQWLVVALIIVTGTIFNASMSLGPILQGRILDFIVEGKGRQQIISQILIYVAVIVCIQFMRYLKRYYVRVFANRTSASMRIMIYNNITNMDISDLKNEKTGDLMTKAISDVTACVEGMRKFTTEVFDTGILMIFYFVTMLYYDVKLTVIACIFIPIAMYIAERLKETVYKFSKDYRKQLSLVSDITYEDLNNIMLYRVNSMCDDRLEKYGDELASLQKKAVLVNMLENSMQPLYNAISLIGVIFIVYMGGNSVLEGSWTIGDFSAYMTIFAAIALKASKAAKLFNSVQKASVSWARIKPYLSPYVQKEREDIEVSSEAVLNIEHMQFAYPGSDKEILHDISFTARSGQIVGITGPVAGGKSTIGVALQGLYPYKGSIELDGKELKEYTPYEISKKISYMSHDSQLLSDTIYNNITMGEEGDISRVLRDVCLDRDIEEMDKGIDTVVGASGIRLSGGQKARLAMARTLYNKGEVLVLDDPFSAVDIKTEHEIIENLKNNYRDCIIILISHRVSFFEDVDNVVLVNKGNSICGSHKQLMEASSVYRAIVELQEEGIYEE